MKCTPKISSVFALAGKFNKHKDAGPVDYKSVLQVEKINDGDEEEEKVATKFFTIESPKRRIQIHSTESVTRFK